MRLNVHMQLAAASQSQAAAAASCGEFQCDLLPQLQQRALVMANVFALIDKVEQHVRRVRANVDEMERVLVHGEEGGGGRSFWSGWMGKAKEVRGGGRGLCVCVCLCARVCVHGFVRVMSPASCSALHPAHFPHSNHLKLSLQQPPPLPPIVSIESFYSSLKQ